MSDAILGQEKGFFTSDEYFDPTGEIKEFLGALFGFFDIACRRCHPRGTTANLQPGERRGDLMSE